MCCCWDRGTEQEGCCLHLVQSSLFKPGSRYSHQRLVNYWDAPIAEDKRKLTASCQRGSSSSNRERKNSKEGLDAPWSTLLAGRIVTVVPSGDSRLHGGLNLAYSEKPLRTTLTRND